jgi:hypothetical protein
MANSNIANVQSDAATCRHRKMKMQSVAETIGEIANEIQ